MKPTPAQIDKLVLETQKGNTKAFGEIYDVYFQKIYKYVSYKVAEDHVDDLVAAVFVKAWTKINRYKKTKYPFSSWLFRIAHNTVVDHYRTHRDFYELEERIADDNQQLDPSAIANQTLNSDRVHRAVRQLDKKYQEVILLKFMNDMSNKEVAKVLSTNEGNVRTLQFRALKKLKALLEEQEEKALKKLREQAGEARPAGLLRRIFLRSS